MSKNIIKKIIKKFQTNKNLYMGEKITIAEHMIQTAMLAEKNNSTDELICSSLLHDFGHFVIYDPDLLVTKTLDGKHEDLAYNFLNNYFCSEVTKPIKLHVQAKRYLCRDNAYYNLLSNASKISLKLQGGKMNDDEAKKFTSLKFYKDAITLRRYDDEGKKPNIKMKKINEYKDLLTAQLIKH